MASSTKVPKRGAKSSAVAVTGGSSKTPLGLQNKRAKTSPASTDLKERCEVSVVIPDFMSVPKFIIDFFNHAKTICPEEPCGAFKKLKSSRLVGLFELLNGELSELTENDLLLHYRFSTDLPEMQTVLVCDIGRYCLWRDIPRSDDGLIVYVPSDGRFPKIEVIGNRMEHVIVHLTEKAKESAYAFLPKSADVAALKQQMKTVCIQRNKKKYGKAPSGAGLWVEIVNEVGYRPIAEDAGKIKKSLDLLCTTDDEELRQAKMKWLMELVTFAQIANDECDFGMGLELGQWLFLANHELLDKVAHRLLSMAYSLLRRAEYKKILDLQLAPGVRRRKEVDARKQPAA